MSAPALKQGKKIAVLQSNYIPWKGYFDIINTVDEFIVYDSMQYTRQDWRNRNIIKTRDGLKWLSVPVLMKEKYYNKPVDYRGKYYPKITETKVADNLWAEKHWTSIIQAYGKAACFNKYAHIFEKLYQEAGKLVFLSDINILFINAVNEILGITTKLVYDTEYSVSGDKSERLLSLCKAAGAETYLSGPAAKNYLNPEIFADAGIKILWMDYSGYPEYPQLFGKFEHGVTVLDLIFNSGVNAAKYMLSF